MACPNSPRALRRREEQQAYTEYLASHAAYCEILAIYPDPMSLTEWRRARRLAATEIILDAEYAEAFAESVPTDAEIDAMYDRYARGGL